MAGDFLQKFLFDDFPIKGSIVRLQESWSEVRSRAEPPESALEALGEVITAAVLLTSNIKFEGVVSLQLQSDGPVRLLLGQCSDQREVRGIARVNEAQSGGDSDPVLTINLEPSGGGQPYQGIVSVREKGISAALGEYFAMSEQLDTAFCLVAGRASCAGMMLQRMPGEMPDADAWARITQLAQTVLNEELLQVPPSELLHRLYHEENVRVFESKPVSFGCKCSRERVAAMLKSLGEREVNSVVEEQGTIDVQCEYCGSAYSFDRVDAGRLFTDGGLVSPDSPGVQ